MIDSMNLLADEGQKEKDSDEKCLSFMVKNINNNNLCKHTSLKEKRRCIHLQNWFSYCVLGTLDGSS